MHTNEHSLRTQSFALLQDIQSWVIEREIRNVVRELKTIQLHEESISSLEKIYQAMLNSSGRFRQIADSHRDRFLQQMQKIGATNATPNEAAIEGVIAQSRLAYLQALEKLFTQVNALLQTKSIDPDAPVLVQVEHELAAIEARAEDRLAGALDEARQRSNGVQRYRWLTVGDERVRDSHAARHGQIFNWDDDGIKPGQEYGCRCGAEPVANENGEYQVAVLQAIPLAYEAYVLSGAIIAAAGAEYTRRRQEQDIFLNEGAGEGGGDAKPDTNEKPNNDNKNPDEDPNDPLKKPQGVPDHWEEKLSDKGEGKKWVDPDNIHNDVRVQKGNPDSDYPSQHEDYVRWKKDGQWLDKDGNASTSKPDTHIPKDEFNFDPELFK